MGKDIRSFPLPLIDFSNDAATGVAREIYKEHIIEVNEEDKYLHKSLNIEQMDAYKFEHIQFQAEFDLNST
jgi:hypothetical protein